MARLELSLLGPMQVSLDGLPIEDFGTDKTRALLVYVLVEGTNPQRRETLTGLLWPDQPEEAARRSLRQALFKLRRVLGEQEQEEGSGFLLAAPQLVQPDPGADYRLDVTEFSQLIAACKTHRHRKPEHCASCHARLLRAAELYRGDFFQDFFLEDSQPFDEWLVFKREGLRRNVLWAFASLTKRYEARGEYEQALHYAYRQLDLEPWREEVHRQIMSLLGAMGQRTAALAQYEACRRTLNEQLGAEPDAETTALYERLRAGDALRDDGRWTMDDGSSPSSLLNNLPRSLAPFIGREEELARIAEQLDSPHYSLITVVGPGGVGKTQLALEAARRQIGAFNDGVYWVPLASVSSPELVASSIAQATGLHFEGAEDPQVELIGYLRRKEMLLVLDNFEQLLGRHGDPRRRRASDSTGSTGPIPESNRVNAADLLVSILREAPQISILVTSRERLGLRAEFTLDLSGLPFPSEDSSSDALGSYGAVQLFVERAQQAHSGFTLSNDTARGVVEICQLVAGLPLGIVLAAACARYFSPARIAASIRANLDFLTSSSRDASPQHTSLRAVFDHSWDLLSDEEKGIFRSLSVFHGGWEEEAAERVAEASLFSLLALVDKSLLRQSASGRFGLHEVLRQYATEKLDEAQQVRSEVRHRHATYYLELAELAEVHLRGEEQSQWLDQLEREHDNLREALRWVKENTGSPPGRELEMGLRLGAALWRFWYVRGYISEGREELATLLAMPDSAEPVEAERPEEGADQARITELMRTRARALNGAGVLASVQGDHNAARILYEESLALRRHLADKEGIASSLNALAIGAHQQGNYDAAQALYEESLALWREVGEKWGVAASLNNLGLVAQYRGDYDTARSLHEESLALRRELGDKLGIASSFGNLGLVAQERGDYDAARTLYNESLTIRKELGDKAGMAELFSYLGLVAQRQGQYDAARSLHEESLALRRELGDRIGIAGSLACLGAVMAGKARLERMELERRRKEPANQVGQLERAAIERAARLFGAVDKLLEGTPARLSIEERQAYEENLEVVRELLNEEAFAKAWSEGRAMTMERAIEYALQG